MPAGHWKRLATSWVLLAAVVLLAAGLLALIGSTVLPQAGLFVWAAVILLGFLLLQLVVFRLLGLRSRADEQPDPRVPGTAGAARDTLPRDAPPRVADTADAPPVPDDVAVPTSAGDERERDWRAWRG